MRNTITDVGRSLLNRAELGEISMEFCEIRAGNGTYEPTDDIAALEDLRGEKNTYSISSAEKTKDGLLITAAISNTDGEGQSVVSESYKVNEIGIYVQVNNEKYLYVIAVADNDTGNTLPAFTGNNALEFVEKFELVISNTAQVTINMGGAYALASDLQATNDRVTALEENTAEDIERNILALTLAVSVMQEAQVNGTVGNMVIELFDDTSGYIIASGLYDSTNKRVYA